MVQSVNTVRFAGDVYVDKDVPFYRGRGYRNRLKAFAKDIKEKLPDKVAIYVTNNGGDMNPLTSVYGIYAPFDLVQIGIKGKGDKIEPVYTTYRRLSGAEFTCNEFFPVPLLNRLFGRKAQTSFFKEIFEKAKALASAEKVEPEYGINLFERSFRSTKY